MDFLFGFSGRIGRLQWWLAQLAIYAVLALGIGIAFGIVATDDPGRSAAASEGLDGRAAGVFLAIAAAVVLMTWINIASTVKRFHDRDKSGLWFLITFIPFIGPIWLLVECGFLPGSPGANSHGSPPGSGGTGYADIIDGMASEYSRPEPNKRQAAAALSDAPKPISPARRPAASGFGRRGLS
jgi:uncharacterized membrane protein YhaH (DUF805 family)